MAMRQTKRLVGSPPLSESRRVEGPGPRSFPPTVEGVVSEGSAAWGPFIEAYSPFLMGCARRFATDYDERMEIYLYVSHRLRDQDCKRIRQFRGVGENGPCKFTTWLGTVAHNLAREWIRTQRGRRRLYKGIADLPQFDQDVFRYRFWEGYAISEIALTMQARHGLALSEDAVVESLRRIHTRLGNDQHWRLLMGPGRRQRGPSTSPVDDMGDLGRVTTASDVASAVAARTLREALAGLPETERLSLELRYREGRSARQIARILGTKSYKRVYEIQARALSKLRARLQAMGVEFRDFAAWLNEEGGAP